MREIGGYLELEHYNGREYHEGCLALSCGRSALAYLIQEWQIREIALPYFLCGCVGETCRKLGVHVLHYHITDDFMPSGMISENAFVYVVNYYGQLGQAVMDRLAGQYAGRLIADNAQAFFEKPVRGGWNIIYMQKIFRGCRRGLFIYRQAGRVRKSASR